MWCEKERYREIKQSSSDRTGSSGAGFLRRMSCRLRDTRRLYSKKQDGSTTVEFVLWLPVLMGVVMLGTDATLLMNHQVQLSELARDAARMVAVGNMTTEEAENATVARIKDTSGAYSVSVSVDGEYVMSDVNVPFNSVVLFNGLFVGSAVLHGSVAMWMEE